MTKRNEHAQPEPRTVQYRARGPLIPLDLVRARDAGEVVFVVGAGVSKASGLPLFKELTRDVFLELSGADPAEANTVRHAEHKAFETAAYDVALGLLEDRYDSGPPFAIRQPRRRVRDTVARVLNADKATSLDRHRDLLILSRDSSGRPRLVTTNFDTLFERAWTAACGSGVALRSRAGGALPGPGTPDFTGVLHLHGRLSDPSTAPLLDATELVLTAPDFGDAYLRSGWAARLLYDLVRRYHLVLVGYGAEDPPLKYLLNVISADRRRFADLKTIYAFASTSDDASEVTQMWLAKGIRPLLYETDGAHAHLYATLSEWAASVDDPQAWAERRLREVGGRSYAETEAHDRGVMELLLTSSANCTLFKGLGGDFSWIRAVEEVRPSRDRESSGAADNHAASDSYPASFSAWLHDRLETPAAMAWAVDRLAPPRRRSRSDEIGTPDSAVPDEGVSSTDIRGFSPDEISILENHIDRHSKTWRPACRRFWSLLSRAARDDPSQYRNNYAYGLLERWSATGTPDLGDVERLASFLRPRLRLERPWRWITAETKEEASAEPFDPQSLTSRSLHWDGHPGHDDICEALPDDSRWLVLLLRALEAELDATYRLAAVMGWMEDGRDLLNTWTHRVATDSRWARGRPSDDDERADPDRYSSDHRALVRVLSGAWGRLAGLDPVAARRIAEGWRLRDEALYHRLHLYALGHGGVFTAREVSETLLVQSDEDLWGGLAETTLLIIKRWQDLLELDRATLEGRLRAGPPLTFWDEGSDDQKRGWQRSRAQRLLAVIAASGGSLSSEAQLLVNELAQEVGPEAVRLTTDDLLPGGVHVRYVPEGDASVFEVKEGAALVAALESAGDERKVGESDAAAAFVRHQPERTLQALLATPDAETAHGDLWRQLLWRLSEDDWIKKASDDQKRLVLCTIGQLLGEALDTASSAAARWLEKSVVGPDEAIPPFLAQHQALLVTVWTHLADHALRLETEGTERVHGASQGERLMGRAYNSAAGELAFIALALLDRARRTPNEFTEIVAQAHVVEDVLAAAQGSARALVAARLAEWAHIAATLLPRTTEDLVLQPMTGRDDDAALSLLDLHALYGRGLTHDLYKRLEPVIVKETKRARLSAKGIAHLVARLTWRSLDRLAGIHDAGLEPSALRAVLQQTSDEGRSAAADAVRDWFQARPPEQRADLWTSVGRPFFDRCWAFDATLRSPGLSQHLARLPALLGSAFAAGVETIAALIVPFEVWDTDTLFLYFGEHRNEAGERVLSDDATRRACAARDWGAALDLVDAALGPSPKIVPYDLAEWLKEISALVPEAAGDPRLKRLVRLTQR